VSQSHIAQSGASTSEIYICDCDCSFSDKFAEDCRDFPTYSTPVEINTLLLSTFWFASSWKSVSYYCILLQEITAAETLEVVPKAFVRFLVI
jgi:hypothetical protein